MILFEMNFIRFFARSKSLEKDVQSRSIIFGVERELNVIAVVPTVINAMKMSLSTVYMRGDLNRMSEEYRSVA